MPTYNCITDSTLLSVKRYGASPFTAGAGETLTNNCGKRLIDKLIYTKIVTGVMTAMTAGEITAVDDATAGLTDITAATTLTATDSGAYTVSQGVANYIITLPAVAKGLVFIFQLIAEAAFTITIRATSTHLYGAYHSGSASTQINASTDIVFDATDANIGDTIRMRGIDSTHWDCIGITTDASGISLA